MVRLSGPNSTAATDHSGFMNDSQKRGRPRLKWGVHAAVGCAAGVAIVHVGAKVEEVGH